MSIEVRQIARFDQVRFRGPGTLKITQTDHEALSIHAPAYVMTDIISEVKAGVLHVGYRSPKVTRLRVLREVISFDLHMKDIRGLTVTGSGSVVVPDLDNDAVRVEVNGSGKVNLEHLTADKLQTSIRGTGSVRALGDVETQVVTINGAGRYEAEHLVSDFAQLTLNGPGSMSVSVSEELNVLINGSGGILYGGVPDISKSISGSGTLKRRRRDKHLQRGEEHG
ncbi:MAG: DUF2807 domain-containing protein [Proteobacteria bacterium]|nr:DUF2807 domain-containing protein [Pseudomonadota bacterium]